MINYLSGREIPMKWCKLGAMTLAAAWGLFMAHSPLGAQNYSPGDAFKYRGMGAQTQRALEDRERWLREKKAGGASQSGKKPSTFSSKQPKTPTKPPASAMKPVQQPKAQAKPPVSSSKSSVSASKPIPKPTAQAKPPTSSSNPGRQLNFKYTPNQPQASKSMPQPQGKQTKSPPR